MTWQRVSLGREQQDLGCPRTLGTGGGGPGQRGVSQHSASDPSITQHTFPFPAPPVHLQPGDSNRPHLTLTAALPGGIVMPLLQLELKFRELK